MDSFERFNESILPNKKAFYSKLNLENITDKDYIDAKKVFKEFKIKNLGQCHYLYVQNDTLLLSDVFESQEINVVKYMNLILLTFCLHLDQHV